MKSCGAGIKFENVSLKFKLYSDKGMSLKESIINSLRRVKYVQDVTEFWVLNNINFEIKEGDRIGIIGNNGAGKSTLLKLISKIYEPTQGKIEVHGKVAPLIELGAGFNPELTGRENIYLNGAILGHTKEEMQSLEQKIIDFSELQEFIDIPIKYYSTGMYGRLAFTLATEVNPDILIIDEIFAGGDINFIDKATKRLNDLISSAHIVITVSHSLDLIRRICNRCFVISEHRMVFDGVPEKAIDFYKEINKETS